MLCVGSGHVAHVLVSEVVERYILEVGKLMVYRVGERRGVERAAALRGFGVGELGRRAG